MFVKQFPIDNSHWMQSTLSYTLPKIIRLQHDFEEITSCGHATKIEILYSMYAGTNVNSTIVSIVFAIFNLFWWIVWWFMCRAHTWMIGSEYHDMKFRGLNFSWFSRFRNAWALQLSLSWEFEFYPTTLTMAALIKYCEIRLLRQLCLRQTFIVCHCRNRAR